MSSDACDADWPFRLDMRDVDYCPLVLAERSRLGIDQLIATGRWDADSAQSTIEALIVRDLIEISDPFECTYCLTDVGGPYLLELEAIARAEHDSMGNPGPEWQCTASTEKGMVRDIIKHYGHVSPLLYMIHIMRTPIPHADDLPWTFVSRWHGPYRRAVRRLHALTLDGTLDRAKKEAAEDTDSDSMDDAPNGSDDVLEDDIEEADDDAFV